MTKILEHALSTVGPTGRFDVRKLYRKPGNSVEVPSGVGSVLRRAVRDGLIRVVDQKRKGLLVYEFTPAGLAYLNRPKA